MTHSSLSKQAAFCGSAQQTHAANLKMSKKLLLELLDFTRKLSPSNGKPDRTFILASFVQTLAML